MHLCGCDFCGSRSVGIFGPAHANLISASFTSEVHSSCQYLAKTVGCFHYSEHIAEHVFEQCVGESLDGRRLAGMCGPEDATAPRNIFACTY